MYNTDQRLATLANVFQGGLRQPWDASDSRCERVEQLHDSLEASFNGISIVTLKYCARAEEQPLKQLMNIGRLKFAHQSADVFELRVVHVEGRLVLEVHRILRIIGKDNLDQPLVVVVGRLSVKLATVDQRSQRHFGIRNAKNNSVYDFFEAWTIARHRLFAASLLTLGIPKADIASNICKIDVVKYFEELLLVTFLRNQAHCELEEIAGGRNDLRNHLVYRMTGLSIVTILVKQALLIELIAQIGQIDKVIVTC